VHRGCYFGGHRNCSHRAHGEEPRLLGFERKGVLGKTVNSGWRGGVAWGVG